MQIWVDGRSGIVGSLAGNLVLSDLSRTEGLRFTQRKGTTFNADGKLVVGRVSSDSYLGGRDVHWANLSLDQHREVMAEARGEDRKLFYLFITPLANEPEIHYWMIPADVIERVAFSGKKDSRFVYALHIRQNQEGTNRFVIDDSDVTDYHHILRLAPAVAAKINDAFASARRMREKRQEIGKRRLRSDKTVQRDLQHRDMAAETDKEDFHIPLKGGRSAVLSIPVPAAEVDLVRIKGWIDLFSDVLTESSQAAPKSTPSAEEAMAALERMRRDAMAAGMDKITSDEIDAEIKKARRERR